MENIWSKFELRATFPVGATQSGDMKKYRILSLSGGKPKIEKMYIEGQVIEKVTERRSW